jgi:hypothetical protein
MAKKDMRIPEKPQDHSEIDIDPPKRSGASLPGKTPGSAEGEEKRRDKPYPNGPGKTPGNAEG